MTPHSTPLSSYDEALEQLLSDVSVLTDTEEVAVQDALGRVLANPVVSCINQPPWDNSAMDGYAYRLQDILQAGDSLPVSQRIPAGSAPEPLQAGTAARIFTGAPVPSGADTVIMQELTEATDDQVSIQKMLTKGANIRRLGEDIKDGDEVLSVGTRLQPQHLGMAASVGAATLTVYRRLKVALLASGDELIMPGNPLQPGQIYNSNQFSAIGLLQALGCEVISPDIVEDTFDATCDALAAGAKQADLVLASGGVSVGEEDHIKPAVEKLGSLNLWKIAIRPGKPLAYGKVGDTPFIGCPGNPVSLFVTFLMFARPYLLAMQGRKQVLPKGIKVPVGFDWPRPDKRREFVRVRLVDNDGQAELMAFPSRSSGVLSSVAWADGIGVIEESRTLSKGDEILYLSFEGLMS